MDLQSYLLNKFASWRPPPPTVEGRTKCDVTLSWSTEPFDFLEGDLLFWVQKKEKMPPWVMVYSGGKMTKTIDNLAPRHPHKFRIKVILKATAVPMLAKRALEHFGNEKAVCEHVEEYKDVNEETKVMQESTESSNDKGVLDKNNDIKLNKVIINVEVDNGYDIESVKEEREVFIGAIKAAGDIVCDQENTKINSGLGAPRYLMATGQLATGLLELFADNDLKLYTKVQAMLEERPALIEIVNSSNGFTPLATAVRKGDINTVKFLLTAGANVNQKSSSGQTPLHLAALGACPALVDMLMDHGADFQARDLNGLRVEHYAVDAGSTEMLAHILQRGGDLHVKDNNGWTPLFRAVTQGASTELIELLVLSGSDINAADYAGLGLPSAARLLHNRHGRERDSILRLIDSQYPHEQAVANFTRLTKKISSLHSILK